MATEITMPQLGESVVDGTVGEWLKQVGDDVEEFEPIVRVSTDKVDTEIPAPADGVLLAVYVQEGDVVDAGTVLSMVGTADETDADDHKDSKAKAVASNGNHSNQGATVSVTASADPPERARSSNNGGYGGHVTPVVARMADEHDLDLSQITGTGRNGRIRKKDVLAYLESAAPADEPAPWEVPADGDLFKPSVNYEDPPEPAAQTTPDRVDAPAPPTRPAQRRAPATSASQIPGELVQLSRMRQSIAKHMVESKLHTAPHVTTVMEADLSAVVAHRKAHKAQLAKQGVKLTFTPYFVLACAQALLEMPDLNARWTDDGIYQHHVAHIGMATAIDDGLIVPVIKHAQDYNLVGLARQVNDLAERARQGQLQPDEVRDGTFTITNHGVSGSLLATPIINQPQSAILGVGMIEKRVKVVDDAIAIRPCTYLSLTFDHRVADGATADHFLMTVKQTLENWT